MKEKQAELPGLGIKPLKWQAVKVYSGIGGTTVEFEPYLLDKPLTSEQAETLYDNSRLPALKEAREILDREITEMGKT